MKKNFRKTVSILVIILVLMSFIQTSLLAQETKIGYVDLGKTFYAYKKMQELEKGVNEVAEASQNKRNTMIQEITKMRDEAELLNGPARDNKRAEIDARIRELQEFERQSREQVLIKRNDMFRIVMEDIQKVVAEMGKAGKYDYILDSRNVIYATEDEDLTDQVIEKLNK